MSVMLWQLKMSLDILPQMFFSWRLSLIFQPMPVYLQRAFDNDPDASRGPSIYSPSVVQLKA